MDIADRVETAVSGIIPVYGNVPEFMDDEPERYAIYDITERGADYAEGENRVNEYMISLNVFTKSYDYPLYEQLKAAMYAAGMTYYAGGKVADNTFPYAMHYYLDFVGLGER